MKLQEIYDEIDSAAPFSLSREFCLKYNGYDNSGVILDCGKEIKRMLFSLDCSRRSVGEALKAGADLLVTHHPAIYSPVKNLNADDPVLLCAQNGISVISAHLNLDCAAGGIDDCLAEALGAEKTDDVMSPLSEGGYGKLFHVTADLKETSVSFDQFLKRAAENLGAKRVISYCNHPVRKVASFCGAGMDGESVAYAVKSGADTFVSSDPKHHLISFLAEAGLNVVLFTHYVAENYGFQKFYCKIKEKCKGVRADIFTDERFL